MKELDLVEKVTKEKITVKELNSFMILTKSFIDANNENYFVRYACQYLQEQKLIEICRVVSHDVRYTLTYSGLIMVKTGGLFWSRFWLQFKLFIQYTVWLVAILTFVVNCKNTLKYNKVSNEVVRLDHKIMQSKKINEHQLKKLNLKLDSLLRLQKCLVKPDTIYLKPHK